MAVAQGVRRTECKRPVGGQFGAGGGVGGRRVDVSYERSDGTLLVGQISPTQQRTRLTRQTAVDVDVRPVGRV